MSTVILTLVARILDCQDGSMSFTAYNNREELAADLLENGDETTVEEIESEDDPYENGVIREFEVELEIDEDGAARITTPFSLSN